MGLFVDVDSLEQISLIGPKRRLASDSSFLAYRTTGSLLIALSGGDQRQTEIKRYVAEIVLPFVSWHDIVGMPALEGRSC